MKQGIVAVIVKIDFGAKSGVDQKKYLKQMEKGEWDEWNTPRKYKHLDGKGRKLILYDSKQKALTVEVEIQKVEKLKRVKAYPWKNKFAPKTLDIYAKPIPVAEIRAIKGFENFGVYRKDRTPYRNVTRAQYAALIAHLGSETKVPSIQKDKEKAETTSPIAFDIDEPAEALRIPCSTYRILRDTELARRIKKQYDFACQICGKTINLKNNQRYAEAHHLKPLGTPHNGPDIQGNIICVCPNDHVLLDYGAVKLKKSNLHIKTGREIKDEYIDYHNSVIYNETGEIKEPESPI